MGFRTQLFGSRFVLGSMDVFVLCAGLVLAAYGCSRDHARGGSGAGQPALAMAGGSAGEAGDGAAVPDLRSLLSDAYAAASRQVRAGCLCAIAGGSSSFSSEDECVKMLGGDASWVDCAAMALADQDSAQVRMGAQCFLDYLHSRADCIESVPCDQLSTCPLIGASCLQIAGPLLGQVILKCPQTNLLLQ